MDRYFKRCGRSIIRSFACVSVLLIGVPALAAAAPASAPTADAAASRAPAAAGAAVQGVWRHHHASFNYFGITSIYTCDGLRGKVRELLVYLGARADLKVTASACASFTRPTRTIVINTDFYSLAPAGANASATVPAHWTAFTLNPHQPYFMDPGECELVDQIKPLLMSTFTLSHLAYHTTCVPHQVTFGDYGVTGQILKPVLEPAK